MSNKKGKGGGKGERGESREPSIILLLTMGIYTILVNGIVFQRKGGKSGKGGKGERVIPIKIIDKSLF